MSAPRHLARYIVLCSDRCCRHSGAFVSLPNAQWWARNPGCCPAGDHKVVRASTWQGVR